MDRMKTWIEDWTGKLEEGDLTGIRIAYSAFGMRDAGLISRAGRAIAVQLSKLRRTQLLRLCERFRQYTSLEWSIDWAEVSLDVIRRELPQEAYRYVLILGSFHPCGYFREKCMYEMAGQEGMLFWLLFRVNDWVGNIRTGAGEVVEKYLQRVDTEELLASIPALERLQDCHRRTENQMQKLQQLMEERLSQALEQMDISELPDREPAVRKALYRLLTRSKLLGLEELDDILRRERIPFLKRILMGGILSQLACTVEWAERYLGDSCSAVRRMAVEYRYEHMKTAWPGLEELLLDNCRGVRTYAAYILSCHSEMDIRGYYLDHLGDDRPESAVMGLAEFSREGNVEVLMQLLERPERKVQKCVLYALGYQEDFADEEILWRFLMDERVDISKAAYLSIQRRDFHFGAERIYDAYMKAEEGHRRRYLRGLLLREGSWSRLPCLIRIYDGELPENDRFKILLGIKRRFMYTKLSQTLREEVLTALKEHGRALPEGVERQILYDMKYV
ncbi:MAG: hypothetical protein NC543_15400 [bacterium]|nr:hypothetical protein [bacterium]MCM1376672.1 hypothetical protein [Muribaculum sp.]